MPELTNKAPLVDSHGRTHTSLRISVTDRCNIRCFYCMPNENVRFRPRDEILTFEEIIRFVRVVSQMGVHRLRLTGGEPLLQPGVLPLMAELCDAGRTVLLETSGERDVSAVDPRVHRIVDLKSPDSGEAHRNRVPHGELSGRTLGIIGFGRIGRAIAVRARAFGVRIATLDRSIGGDGQLVDDPVPPRDLHRLLAMSDYVAIACPLTEATRGMIGERELAAMKRSAYFINVGRGATVDEAALARALKDGRIAGAAVDVFAQEPPPDGHPLYALDNVIVSPHVSGFVPSYDDWCSDLFAEKLRRYLAGAPLLNQVNRSRGY